LPRISGRLDHQSAAVWRLPLRARRHFEQQSRRHASIGDEPEVVAVDARAIGRPVGTVGLCDIATGRGRLVLSGLILRIREQPDHPPRARAVSIERWVEDDNARTDELRGTESDAEQLAQLLPAEPALVDIVNGGQRGCRQHVSGRQVLQRRQGLALLLRRSRSGSPWSGRHFGMPVV